MVVEMPSGSKPTSPTIEPSSAGGALTKGMLFDMAIVTPLRAGRLADGPLKLRLKSTADHIADNLQIALRGASSAPPGSPVNP